MTTLKELSKFVAGASVVFSIIPAIWDLRKKEHEFTISLGYIVNSSQVQEALVKLYFIIRKKKG